MSESFVDLGYRGVSLARRVKLARVRPTTGYLETPAPMPVGTAIAIVGDDGVMLDAVVTAVHEQVSGSAVVPGMAVAPALAIASEAAKAWWEARVTAPADDEPVPRAIVAAVSTPLATPAIAAPSAPAPVRVTTTAPMPAVAAPPAIATVPDAPIVAAPAPASDRDIAGAAVAAKLVAATRSSPATRPPPMPMIEDDYSKRTTVMDAVSAEMLAELSASDSNPKLPLEDDGRSTEMMASVDLAALGLDPASGASGKFAAIQQAVPHAIDDGDDDPSQPVDPDKPPERPSAGAVKRRRKKR